MPKDPTRAPPPSRDPDLDELQAWQGGDQRAGNRLLSKHYDTVYNFFNRKIGGDVGDLVQGTFITCLQVVARFERRSTFRTFLLGIARNKLLEHLRSRRNSPNTPMHSEVTSLQDLGVSPTQLLRDQQQSRLVYEALRRIPIDHQLLLELFYWEKLKGHEIAGVFEIPENTVRARLRRARELLKQSLGALETDADALKTTIHNLDDHILRLRDQAHAKYPQLDDDPETPVRNSECG
ncbi:MAG: sigma-70 family RNA polymerase sigma factor [Deltaproteobacteria bacterium]|nr:sigma-70 family RNA polymerase sigma factor [Deltaproteobacteria bacterium]